MPILATRVTSVNLLTARTLLDGSFRVHSILIANTWNVTAVPIEFTDLDDVPVLTVYLSPNTSFSWNVVWLADNGLKVAAINADVIVTITHSADGI